MNTHDMLMAILKAAESYGQYDGYELLELEYQEIIEKAKAFNKKVEEIYNNFKKGGIIDA